MKRLIIAAALVVSTVTAPAFAASNNFKMEVNYSSQHLTTRDGAEKEYDHIRKQVSERCTAEHADFMLSNDFAHDFCVRRAMDSAVRSISNPLLSEVHTERR